MLILFNPCGLRAAETRTLQGHVPGAAANLPSVGRLPSSQRLDLALGLPLRNREALNNLLRELYDPLSPQYHQFLTPEQFTELFGPSLEDYERLINFAQANGFTVTRTHDNRVLLDVNASVGDIERVFRVTMRLYEHPVESRRFYAPDAEPTVDISVPILDISGLENFHLPRPLVHPKAESSPTRGAQPQLGSGPGGTFRGSDFRAAYAPKVAATGIGQTVGLLEFDGYYASDITSYENQTGLPTVPLTNVLLDGYNGSPGSGNIEVALDIEMAIAMAPGLSQVIVYEAGPSGIPNDILNRMATDNLAKQLSSSWTWSGGPDLTTDQIFQQLASQGQSFFQACGDSGAYTGLVDEPADNPYITIVGGTTLSTTGPAGSWASETTWNWYNTGSGTSGTGGGVSTTYSIPTWQQGISMSGNQGSTTMRNIPDVALTADNIWVAYNNGSSGAVGGTSCAAPLWAGFTALINQQALGNGKPVVGFINPAIYSIGTGTGYGSTFHDITTGNNTNKSSPTKFFAVSGFDLCTGWGTPVGGGLITALAGSPAPQIVSNSLALAVESCTNNGVDPGETVTMNFGLINTGSANTTNLVATLQATGGVTSPSAAQIYGTLTAGGAAVSRPFSFTASGTCGGVVTATLQLQDGASNLGTVNFAIPLGALVSSTTFTENFDGVAAPALPSAWTTAVLSGLEASWASTNGFSATAPNSVFAPDATTAGETVLISPSIPIISASAQMTFRQNYNLALRTTSHPRSTNYYDGGRLEISIGGGPFTEIQAAGGSFAAGGYNCTLATGTGNPLAGQAWGGTSGGWVTTTVNLPAAAAGQNVQLRWDLGTGANTSAATGWFIDAVSVQDSWFQCCTPNADVRATQSVSPNPGIVGQNLSYTLAIANAGPLAASNVAVTDSLPSSVTFVSASPGCVNLGGSISCTIGTLPGGGLSNIVVTVKPTSQGTITNSVTVTSTTADPNLANNQSLNTTTVYIAPSITSQPTNAVAVAGGNANFYVSATGSTPLNYQWTFGGSAITGATTTTLGLANVQASQAGNYSVIVSNPSGSVTSTVATLTVLLPPLITRQPTNQTVVVGANATFQDSATGTAPLSYQWLFNGSSPVGTSSNTLTLGNVQLSQAGSYSVVVTNVAGSVTSAVATLTVLVPPSITLQPSNQTAVVGGSANFQGVASGSTPLSYQWFLGGTALPGATGTTLGLTNVQTNQVGNYSFVATNAAGAVTSIVAHLTVLVPPSISSQPTNQTVIAGSSASFQVSASGTSPLNYQWWANGTNAVGTSTNLLTVTNAQPGQAGAYSVVVTNSAGSVTSSVAILTVGTPPSITQQPSAQTVVQGQNAMFTVAASGDSPLNYQWRFNGVAIGGSTGSSYTVNGATTANAGNYDVVVGNAYGSLTSAVAHLTVLVPPSISSQPTNQTVIAGSSASFQVSASGTSPLNYQWWANGTNAVGTSTNLLMVTNAQPGQAGAYSVVVTNSAGSVTSSVAILTVGTPPSITQQPSDLTVVQGQNAMFTVAASGSAPLNYQWRFNGAPIGAGTSYTVSGATTANAGSYDVVVGNVYGSMTSVVAQLTVLMPPSIISQPTNQTVIAGSNVNFMVSASGTSPLAYQWWFNGTNAVGSNTNVLAVINAQTSQAGAYSVVVTNSAGLVTSSAAMLTVGTSPSITQQPFSLTVVQGQNAMFTVAASGDSPLNYQWRFNGAPIGGSTGSNYTVSGATTANAGNYDVVVGNAYGSMTSVVAQLTVLMPPSIISQPTNQTVIAGSSASFQVSATGTAPLGYQWWFNGTNAVGNNTNTLTVTNAQTSQAGAYSLVVTNSAGSITSSVAMLTIGIPPSITQQPSSLTIVQGQNATFTVAASGDTPLNYQWRFNGAPIGGSTSSNYTVSGATTANAGNYDVVVGNAYGSLTSLVAQLTVLVPPSISSQPTNQTVIAGSSASFQVNASGTSPLNYQWWFNGTNAVGTSTNVLTVTNAQPAQAGDYSVVVTNNAGSVTSSVAILIVGTPPSITQQPSSLTVVQGQNAMFTVAANGDTPLNYQWRFNGASIGGSTSSSYTVSGATTAAMGNYDVVVGNTYGSMTSLVAQLTVLVPPSITSQPTNQTVAAGSSVNFLVNASGTSPLAYQWWFNGTNAVGNNTNTLTVVNSQTSQAGAYSVVVTNSAGSVTSSVVVLTIGIPPSITQEPASLTVVQGQGATFSVAVTGDTPLNYQWRLNGAPVGGAAGSSYTVAATTITNAGIYDVVVTNDFGSATSTAAQLKVLVAPSIINIAAGGNTVSVSVTTLAGLNYQLQYKNSLTDALWNTASPWTPGTGGVLVLQDTNTVVAGRFYRVNCE
jgi:uncharacterized repeat protein (TIGR01451 family)